MMVKFATGVPLINTLVTPLRLVPVMVNCPDPAHKVSGETLLMVGAFVPHAKKSSPSSAMGPGATVGVVIKPVAGRAPDTP